MLRNADTSEASDAKHGDQACLPPRSGALSPAVEEWASALSFTSTPSEPDCTALID
jgi:hypothetical protein